MIRKIGLALAICLLATPVHAQHWRGGGYGGGWHRGGGDFGGALLGGLIGGAIGGVLSRPEPQYYPPPQQYYPPPQPAYTPDAYSYCSQTFRSWNPNTSLYLGYDGIYHRCPQ